ncbi:MAG: tyrosine-type recombinase/integrase [Nitrospirae bacterium]|nr:tyrosine-type recombinase/integrase [Nitrospirota bacterium]
MSAAIEQFLDYVQVEKGLSPHTLENYRRWLDHLMSWLKSKGPGDILVSALTPDTVWKYRLFLAGRPKAKGHGRGPVSRTTQRYFLIVMRAMLRYLAKRGVQAIGPEQVDLPRPNPARVKVLDGQAVERLLAAPETRRPRGLRDRALLEVLFSTGLRVSELVALDRDRVNLTDGEFSVIGKGGRTRVVYLSDPARQWLAKYVAGRKDNEKPLFVTSRGHPGSSQWAKRLSVRSVQHLVKLYCRRAGITLPASPHTLRHSFATDLLGHGADLRSVQELLGHKNVATTQIYTHLTNPQLRDVHRKFHRGGRSS